MTTATTATVVLAAAIPGGSATAAASAAFTGFQRFQFFVRSISYGQYFSFEIKVFSGQRMVKIDLYFSVADFYDLSLQTASDAVHHRQKTADSQVFGGHIFKYLSGQIHDHIGVNRTVGIGGGNFKIKLIAHVFSQQIHLKILQRLSLSADKFQGSFRIRFLQYIALGFGLQLVAHRYHFVLCYHCRFILVYNPAKITKNRGIAKCGKRFPALAAEVSARFGFLKYNYYFRINFMVEEMRQYDYIIAGSGLAGLYVAYHAAAYGKVALLTKCGITESNSYFAQGGIAAVTDEDDAPGLHFEDTIIAGRGLCDYPAVNILVNEGPQRIQELIDIGMHFDMEDGSLALGLEGGHHRKRILHAGGDATGRMVTSFMIGKVIGHPGIDIFENHSVIGILKDDKQCYGVRSWNLIHKKEELFLATNTILTLGGASAIYKRTTNPHTTIGDGLALAYNAGCEIADMEFIQFHPSALYRETEEAFLISEAVRGEGAHLLNLQGERFMPAIHELAELAPRDVVAQAIYQQIRQYGDNYVWLSLRHLDPEMIKSRFPNIYEKCREYGYDMCDRIPVAPAAHYTVGGVRTDLNGQTNIPRLFVCGELASTGIMGANRLASNSLIECLVFGKRAVEFSRRNKAAAAQPEFRPFYRCDERKAAQYIDLKKKIADIMTRYAGIIREKKLLLEGMTRLDELERNIPGVSNEYYTLISRNLVTVAKLIVYSALYRKESRGGHFRSDYPGENKEFLFHIVQQAGNEIRTIPIDTEIN